MSNSDMLMVGFDHTQGDIAVLIVGRRDGQIATIVNQFKGEEAEELYRRLTEKKEIENGPVGD